MTKYGIWINWRALSVQDWWREDGKVKLFDDPKLAEHVANNLPAFTSSPATCRARIYDSADQPKPRTSP